MSPLSRSGEGAGSAREEASARRHSGWRHRRLIPTAPPRNRRRRAAWRCRGGRARFDAKLDILAQLARDITERRGHADPALVAAFRAAGWSQENLVDLIMAVGDKIISNYLHGTTGIPVDFPAAPAMAA